MPPTPDLRRSTDQIRGYLIGGNYTDPVSNADTRVPRRLDAGARVQCTRSWSSKAHQRQGDGRGYGWGHDGILPSERPHEHSLSSRLGSYDGICDISAGRLPPLHKPLIPLGGPEGLAFQFA